MRLLTVLWRITVEVWDLKSGATTVSFAYHSNQSVKTAVFSPDEAYIITELTNGDTKKSRNAEAGGKIFGLTDSASGVAVDDINGAEGLKRMAFSHDGARMVTQDKQDRLTLWDARSRQPIAILNGHQGEVNGVAFSPDGTQIASVSSDMTARLWAAESGKELGVLKGHEGSVSLAIFSPSGHQLLTASSDMTARLWNINPLKSSPVSEFRGHQAAVTGETFNADGSRIITRSNDKTSRLWNADNGDTLAAFQVDKGDLGSSTASMTAEVSSDGLRVLSFSDRFSSTSAHLWSAETGNKLAELGTAEKGASFSPDGTRILTVSGEFGARLWDSSDGKPYAILSRPGVRVDRAAFSPDGRLVITVSDDTATPWDARQGAGVVRTFPSTKALLDEAMRESPRCLSLEERKTAYLEEEPPAWCIEQGKWPYHTLRWKAWLDAKRAGQNPAYPVAGQQVAAGADEAFQAGRFEEAMKLQGVLADTFSQATTSVPGGEPATAAGVFAHLSRYALFSKDYAKALSAADRAIELQAEKFLLVGKPDTNAYMNKAHALMFLGRADESWRYTASGAAMKSMWMAIVPRGFKILSKTEVKKSRRRSGNTVFEPTSIAFAV